MPVLSSDKMAAANSIAAFSAVNCRRNPPPPGVPWNNNNNRKLVRTRLLNTRVYLTRRRVFGIVFRRWKLRAVLSGDRCFRRRRIRPTPEDTRHVRLSTPETLVYRAFGTNRSVFPHFPPSSLYDVYGRVVFVKKTESFRPNTVRSRCPI